MPNIPQHRPWLLALALLAVAMSGSADDVTVSGAASFGSLDGSSLDHDGAANGVFTVNDGNLTVLGSINCNDDTTRDACSMNFAVSGNLTIAAGGALYAENRRGSGVAGDISATVGGNLVIAGTVSAGNLSVDRGGDISFSVAGSALVAEGSVISAASKGGQAGDISIESGGVQDIRGLIASGPSATLAATRYTGALLTGGSSNSAGGAITLRSTSISEPAINVAGTATIVSEGDHEGSGTVLIEGCGVVVSGLVASVSSAGEGAKVTIRSGANAVVNGGDLGGTGAGLGMLRADSLNQGAGTYSANVFARRSITILGPASGSLSAMSSSGGKTSRDVSGTIHVISIDGSVIASGNAFAATGSNAGDKGGKVNVSASDDVVLDGATINAAGDFATAQSSRAGGAVAIRSYSGGVSWLGGTGDVRPTGSASGIPAAQQGTIDITYCTTVSTAGASFPTNGSAVGSFPTMTQTCSPASPSLPAGESLPDCNDAPTAVNDAYTVAEGGTLNVPAPGVLANDSDPEGNPLTATLVSGPSHAASFTLNADGSFSYEHDGSEAASDSFTYKASDGSLDSNVATVTITVTPVNDAPVANDDAYSVAEGGTLNVGAPGVLGNDTDAENDALMLVLVSGPAHATSFALNADGSFTYVHDGTETTSDSFTYRANDGSSLSNVATVTITITPSNDAPVANDDSYAVSFHQTLNVAAPGVLTNDTDVDSASLTAVLVSGPSQGNLTLNADGSFSYTHTGATLGTDSFTYQASDGAALSNTATVTIRIGNDAPVATADSFSGVGNTELRVGTGAAATPAVVISGSVLANDTDSDGPSPLTVSAYDAASISGGTVTMNSNGTFNYLPAAGFTGIDTFSYTVTDGQATATAWVSISLNGRVWYLNAAAGGTQSGRSTEPFATLGQAQSASSTNDTIYAAAGTYGGITLSDGQRLVGSGVPLVMGVFTLAPATTAPVLNGTIVLATGNLVTGTSQVLSSTTQGIVGASVTGGTISAVSITGGSAAIVLTYSGGTFTITDVALAPSGDGLTITGGTATVNASNLDIVTTTGTGISGDAGTLNITAGSDGSTIASTGGTPVDLNNMTLGVSLLSINATGGATGIELTNTSGTFTVTGDGSLAANGSGGSLSGVTTRPVHLLGASGSVNLRSMTMSLSASAASGVLVDNNAGGSLSVNLAGCTVAGANAATQSKALLQVEGDGGANVVANVQGSFFNNSFNYGVFATAAGASVMNVTVNQSGFGTDVVTTGAVNNPGSAITLPNAIGMAITNGGSSQVNYTVSNNTFLGASSALGAIYVVTISSAATGAGSHLVGTLSGNRIGQTGVVGSGCAGNCSGIGLLPGLNGRFSATVTGNDIRHVGARGVDYANSVAGAVGSNIIKIKGNNLAEPDATGSFRRAISVTTGNSGGATSNVCAEIGGAGGDANTVGAGWAAGQFIRVTTANTTGTLTLPGLTPAGPVATATEVNLFLTANNPTVAGNVATTVGGAIVGGAACP